MNALFPFLRLLKQATPTKVSLLLLLMLLASLSEGFGILLLVPMLGIIHGDIESDNQLLQRVLDAMEASGISLTIGGLLTLFLVLVTFRGVVQFARDQQAATVEHTLVDQLRLRCFSSLLSTEWRWIAAGRKSDHANLLLTDVSRVGNGLHYGIALVTTLVTMLVYIAAAFLLSWKLTLLAMASGGLVLLLLSGQRKRAARLGEALGIANQEVHNSISESLTGIKMAKILGNEKRHLNFFETVTDNLRHQHLAFIRNVSFTNALISVGGAALLAAYLYVGLNVLRTPIPELLTLVLVFSRLIPILNALQQYSHLWLHALPAVHETERLLLECQASAEPAAPVNSDLWRINQAISLENVTIRYSDREKPALDALSVTFPARTTTAIMGTSGAGKSTLADVLMGLLAPDQGVMTIDGRIVSGEDRLRWRNAVAYVPQDVFLFNDTIRNNLLWAKPGADESALNTVLEFAAADFVHKLPKGLDTHVGDAGIRLSGGERQRIALARALLKQPSLLILDEATSALDIKNEGRIRQAIENLHGDLTVVIIGHRLPTLEHADQVVILDQGKIEAQGDWEEINTRIQMLD